MLDDLYQTPEMGQNGAAHQNGNLLYDLDARVPGLPGLLALAHRFQEGQQRRDAQSRGHDCEGSSSCVTHILIHVIDIGSHGGDHCRQTGRLEHKKEQLVKLLQT